jgi:hypothetical protein
MTAISDPRKILQAAVQEAVDSGYYPANPEQHNNLVDIIGKHMARSFATLSQQHEREVVEAKIQEHANLWEAVPIDTEHVGTVRDISDLMVVKLKARAELQQQSNGGTGDEKG